MPDGEVMTESAAMLIYLADLDPAADEREFATPQRQAHRFEALVRDRVAAGRAHRNEQNPLAQRPGRTIRVALPIHPGQFGGERVAPGRRRGEGRPVCRHHR